MASVSAETSRNCVAGFRRDLCPAIGGRADELAIMTKVYCSEAAAGTVCDCMRVVGVPVRLVPGSAK